MAGYKRALSIKEVLERIDDDKTYFDKLYSALYHYAYESQGKSSDIRINTGKRSYIVSNVVFSEKASKVLRKTRSELRKLCCYIDNFFDSCDE